MRIKNKARLQSHGNKKGRRQILEILEAGMEAADPYYNTLSLISLENDRFLHVGKREFVPAGSPKTEEECYELASASALASRFLPCFSCCPGFF